MSGHAPLPYGETSERPPFRFSATTRVGFDETDAQGVVYYGRYMPYFDRARVEYLRRLDLLGKSVKRAKLHMAKVFLDLPEHLPAAPGEGKVAAAVRQGGKGMGGGGSEPSFTSDLDR